MSASHHACLGRRRQHTASPSSIQLCVFARRQLVRTLLAHGILHARLDLALVRARRQAILAQLHTNCVSLINVAAQIYARTQPTFLQVSTLSQQYWHSWGTLSHSLRLSLARVRVPMVATTATRRVESLMLSKTVVLKLYCFGIE